MKCVVPENIHTSPMERIFFHKPPNPTLNKFKSSLIHFFKCFGLREPPPSRKLKLLLEKSMDIFWDYTIHKSKRSVYNLRNLSVIHICRTIELDSFLYMFWSYRTPPPKEIQIPSWEE